MVSACNPIAQFTTRKLYAGLIYVDGVSSYSPEDTEIVDYVYDFGDRTTPWEGPTVYHSYNRYTQPTDYNVTLTVTDADGLSDSTMKTVRVGFYGCEFD
jgi:hypothetical protein